MLEKEDIQARDGFIFTEATVEKDHVLNTSIAQLLYSQELAIEQGAPTSTYTIPLKDLNNQLVNKSQREQNLIIIEIENDILDMGGKEFTDLMTVSSKIDIPGKETAYIDVKPSVVTIED